MPVHLGGFRTTVAAKRPQDEPPQVFPVIEQASLPTPTRPEPMLRRAVFAEKR
jgi:hypothetical protein